MKHYPHSRRYVWMMNHPLLTFTVMCAMFVLSGASSVQLIVRLGANLNFLREYGWDAVLSGALVQSLELLALTVLTVFGYLGFKTCESALVERFLQP